MKQNTARINEMQKRYNKEIARASNGNPTVTGDIDLVWCLSGRTTVLGNNPDGLAAKRPVDPTDDIERLRLSIDIANKANHQKGTKSVNVVYNGDMAENTDLEKFMDACKETDSSSQLKEKHPQISSYLSKHYKDKEINSIIEEFKQASDIIKIKYGIDAVDNKEDINQDITNTLSQTSSFNNILKQDPTIKKVAAVSSAFHLPRVARAFSNQKDNKLGEIDFVLHGIDLQCQRPGTYIDQEHEVDAIVNYVNNGSINEKVSSNIEYEGYSHSMTRA